MPRPRAPTEARLSTRRPDGRPRSSGRPAPPSPRRPAPGRPARGPRLTPEPQPWHAAGPAVPGEALWLAREWPPSLEPLAPRVSMGEPSAAGHPRERVAPPRRPWLLHASPHFPARQPAPMSKADDRRRALPPRVPGLPRPPARPKRPAMPAARPVRTEPAAAPAAQARGAVGAASVDRRSPSGRLPA
jgi:hypothetical protein